MTAPRILALLAAALLVVVGLPACEEEQDEAPISDPAYDQAVRELRRLEGETLDSDYEDPRFDAVVAALERIPVNSPRWSEAQERLHEIRTGREKAEARHAEVAQMVDTLSTRQGSSAETVPQTPEEMHRKLVASLRNKQGDLPRTGRGRYMPTREQRLRRARARVQNVKNHIGFLEQGLRRFCGGVSISAQPGGQRERKDCVARRRNYERINQQLVEAEKELELLEGR